MEKEQLAEWVLDTMNGFLSEDSCMENVENLFEEGMLCSQLYRKMTLARESLVNRLGCSEEDPDVEEMITLLLMITRIVGLKMFEYGIQFGKYRE